VFVVVAVSDVNLLCLSLLLFQIVNKLLSRAQDKSIKFMLPDEAFGAFNNITVIQGSVIPGITSSSASQYCFHSYSR